MNLVQYPIFFEHLPMEMMLMAWGTTVLYELFYSDNFSSIQPSYVHDQANYHH